VNPDRIKFHVPAGHPLDGTTIRVWPESGATTYWSEVMFTSPERQGVEDALADLRLTLDQMREANGHHIQMKVRGVK
jgi:hypothetical protein